MQHDCYLLSLIFSEVEHFYLHGVAVLVLYNIALRVFLFSPDDASSEIHVVVLLREICEKLHIVDQSTFSLWFVFLAIFVKLSHEDAVGGFGVLVSPVCLEVFFHFSPTVELVCSGEITALLLPEYRHGVDHATFAEIEIDACPEKFLAEHGNIEVV